MATGSKIEWTHHTFNPWRGCTKVSAGCAHCYAETLSKRNPKSLGVWGDNGTRAMAAESYWKLPAQWDRAAKEAGERHRVFCASLADVCEDRHDVIESRIRLKRTIEATPHLDWLLLTKRPENFLRLFYGPEGWPSNIWAGTSVENQQAADERIPHLLRCPAAVRFLSVEPMIGPVDLTAIRRTQAAGFMRPLDGRFNTINWVIVGGESGPKSRPCNIEWIRSIVAQCKAASVPCFVKQLGAHPVIPQSTGNARADEIARKHGINLIEEHCGLEDPKGGDWNEWPDDLRVRQFPKASVTA